MKNIGKIILALGVVAFTTLPAGAAAVNAVARNIADDQVQAGGLGFDLAFSSDMFKVSKQYVKLDYVPYTNAPAWRLDMYTDNKASPALLQMGGLIGVSSNAAHVPLAWKMSTATLPPTVLPVDIMVSTGSAAQGWGWLKDKSDVDDPTTPNMNESWAVAYNGGYTAIASGGLSNSAPATVYLYFEGDFNGAPADNYSCNIWLDMYQVLDVSAPIITNANPLSTIVSLGNSVVLKAQVTDDQIVGSCVLYYQLDGGAWTCDNEVVTSTGTQASKFYQFTLSAKTIGNAAKISYCLVATDGYNYSVLNANGLDRAQSSNSAAVTLGEASPLVINVENEITFNSVTSGSFVVPDGNPNDGNTSITIPSGALSSPENITIQQLDPQNSVDSPPRAGVSAAGSKPVAIYDFGREGLHFDKPIDMTLLFLGDSTGNVYMPDGTVVAGAKKSDLKAFWWDGLVWRALGGKLDDNLDTLTIKTDHFSKYAIFYQPVMSAADYRPKEKIITPNGDGKNDYASFDGLSGEDFSIDIFDIRGHKIKNIGASSLPRWDGTDESGRVVESGVYIYQFIADVNGSGKMISGTIVVAK
jgi:gliding motility-associated-like protein